MVYNRVSARTKVICLSAITLIAVALAISVLGVQNRHMVRGFFASSGEEICAPGATTLPTEDKVVTQFKVVNLTTKKAVVTIEDGALLDIAVLGDVDKLDIRAVVVQPVGFILFSHDGVEDKSKSYIFPYSLCEGLTKGLCLDLFSEGTHTVTAIPYAAAGVPFGPELTVTYIVINSNPDETDTAETNPLSNLDNTTDALSEVAPAVDDTANAAVLEQRKCGKPVLLDEWEWGVKEYPLTVAEAQGAKIGDELLVIGGFIGGYSETTRKGFSLNMTDENAEWLPLDDMPTAIGITHGAFAVAGKKFYMCGGYVGGNIGFETDVCMEYDHDAPPGKQWRFIHPLPQGRAGGGMIYDSELNALLYSAGATRPEAGISFAYDHTDSWMYNLSSPLSGWVNRSDIPFYGNHMGFVTARDEFNRERHFFVGGQQGEEEHTGNTRENYEWIAANDTWVARRSMPLSRGHAASATKAVGCGFMVVGGTTNEHGMTEDISFFDIPSDTWMTVGSLPSAVNTAVCEYGGGYLWCQTGWAKGHFAARRKMELSYI